MKNKFKLAISITVVMLCCSQFSKAQFNVVGTPANDKFSKLDDPPGLMNDVRRMGIGYFIPNIIHPRAALNIDANLLTPLNLGVLNYFLPGEVFRTDGPSTGINAWRLWTGGQIGGPVPTEKGMIFNYGNNPTIADQENFSLQASISDMTFFTLPITSGTVGTERMRILSNGQVGIGTPTPFLGMMLEVNGNINTSNPTNGYNIGGEYVLRHKGNPQNIFVGVGAGLANTTGTQNSFVGNDAGRNNISGFNNTHVGFQAGFTNQVESDNTFIGNKAGYSTYSGYANTFVGSFAGFSNTTGKGNVFVGYQAGYNNTVWSNNTFVGNFSGFSNISGGTNCFFGERSGQGNTTGEFNIFIGHNSGGANTTAGYNIFVGTFAGYGNIGTENVYIGNSAGYTIHGTGNTFFGDHVADNMTAGNNNTYIGYHAQNLMATPYSNSTSLGANTIVTASDKMILGDNSVNVGIGLSGITPAPENKLEINAHHDITSPTDSKEPWIGLSGLRFRDLTSASPVTALPPTTNVLSVNLDGDVILVPGGTGTITSANNGTSLDPNNTTVQLGNILGGTSAQLLSNREIPMHDFNLVFTDGSNTMGVNRIGIGTNAPLTKFQVINNSEAIAGSFRTDKHQQSGDAYGVEAYAIGALDNNRAITAQANGPGIQTMGIWAQAQGAITNYGGHFSVSGTANNYGIYAKAPLPTATAPVSWAGFFEGDVEVNGTGHINSPWIP